MMLIKLQPTQHVSIDVSMVPYHSRYAAKQYTHEKTIRFVFKLWVMVTPLGYSIQLRSYAAKDTILKEYADIGLGLGTSFIAHLVNTLSNVGDSNYHILMNNFCTSPELL